jgi:hypothetical protein
VTSLLERIAAFLTTVHGRSAAGAAAAVIAVVAAGSFIGVRTGAELWDPGGPTTVRFNLKEGQQEVRGDQRLLFGASRPLPLSRVRPALHIEPAADGTLTASGDGQTFTWLPASALADRTAYTVRFDSIPKVDGHRVRGGVWHFRTTTTPRVVGITLASGTAVQGGQIPLGAGLELTFNTAMDTGSVKLLANGSPLGLSWARDRRSARVEGTALKAGRLSLEIGPGGRDAGGRNLAAWRLAAIVVERPQDTPPLAAPALVQIANDAAARDQSGLQSADAVYEYLTEGGITRFTAIFGHAPEVAGPINSGRPISLKLARHYRGMLFMSDLSRGSSARLAADPVPTSLDSPGVFYRSDARSAPDNLYAQGAALQQAEQRLHVPPKGLPTGGIPLATGAAGPEVVVPEHRSTYSYDPSSHTYSKTEDGRRVQDAALQGAPIQIQLLVVLHTTATPTSYAEDGAGHRGLDFDLDAGGQADFYSGGLHASGRWAAPQRQGDIRFTLDGGTQLDPSGGLTWFDVVTS